MILPILSLLTVLVAQASAPQAVVAPPIVPNDWLQQHLSDPAVRVIFTGSSAGYDRGHIPGARLLKQDATLADGHALKAPDVLAAALTQAGAADGSRIVLYSDSPTTAGWIFMTFASIGHAADVSMLETGFDAWQAEKRPVSTTVPPPASGGLTAKPAPDVVVEASWVKSRLQSPDVRVLDVRTTGEWNGGHLPGATLILWQDLFADLPTQRFKPLEQIRALFTRAGVQTGQQVVTYCAIGIRASLMYWAAQASGVPARVYVGSFQDWQRDATNLISKP